MVLRPRKGYVPKVLSIPFRVQVIALLALSLAENKQASLLLECIMYGQFQQSEKLFDTFGG